ncbi:hypothetical protein MKZ38_000336 [Zalerion maritima]|uniref:Uncharacterized protein n=1 Tax=Zalerion maritima TaxID=339359 RepID=A0AAD5RT59_9PEZI|nr:hypothetical protein MKZ38_000336 [Zalerion maritima]
MPVIENTLVSLCRPKPHIVSLRRHDNSFAVMAGCEIPGDASMYGVGIRIGFYFLWFGIILASWIAASQTPLLRLFSLLFSTGALLAVVVRVSSGVSTSLSTPDPDNTATKYEDAEKDNIMRTVEVYIVMLLAFGEFFFLVPVYIWRILTCCNPTLNPMRWPRCRMGKAEGVLTWILLVALAGFHMWFWTEGIHDIKPDDGSESDGGHADNGECKEWGVLMAKVDIRSGSMIAVNIIFSAVVLFIALLIMATHAKMIHSPRSWRRPIEISNERRSGLQHLQNFFSFIVASVTVLAIELTVEWNGLSSNSNLNSIASVGQTIPLLVGLGLFLKTIYKWQYPDPRPPRSRRGSHSHGHGHGHSGGRGMSHKRRDSMTSTGYTYSTGYPGGGSRHGQCHQPGHGHGRGHGEEMKAVPIARPLPAVQMGEGGDRGTSRDDIRGPPTP